MIIKTIKTRKFLPPKDDLFSLIKKSIVSLKEESIVVITSKIVAISQGRCVDMAKAEKDDLIKKEADLYIDRNRVPQGYCILTIKNGILIPSAGIDESNANGYYILWPEKSFEVAKQIHDFLKKEYKVKKIGVIITDSHCVPMRLGVLGIGIAYYGFYPLRDYRGKPDIFGRKMKISQANIVDALAGAAVLEMGEADERTPIAIVENVKDIKFGNFPKKGDELSVSQDDDIYAPLLKGVKWDK